MYVNYGQAFDDLHLKIFYELVISSQNSTSLSLVKCSPFPQLPELLREGSTRLPSDVREGTRLRLNHLLDEYNSAHPAIHITLHDVRTLAQLSI